MFQRTFFLVLVAVFWQHVNSANILGVFPWSGYSQFILGETLMKELVSRGHQVTVISPFTPKEKIENYTSVVTDGINNLIDKDYLYNAGTLDIFKNIVDIHDFGHTITEFTLSHPKVQELINSSERFDVVVCEQFFNEAHYGFAKHYNAPLVLFSSLGLTEWNNHIASNPFPVSYIPNSFLGYSGHMKYQERLLNFFVYIFDLLYKYFVSFPSQNALLNQYFPNPPRLGDIIYNSSLVLLNSHPATTITVPHVPNMIQIGGFHVQPKDLPAELKEFLDSAKEGVILFSMGSNLNSAKMQKDKLNSILNAFSKVKQKVLFKWEETVLENKPENVHISKWFPQMDVLGHKNVKVFVTHGGLLSTTEAVYHGVPIIGIPIYGDQKMNVAVSVENGLAIEVPFKDLTEEKLLTALTEILNNDMYKNNAVTRSQILRDQPIKPLDNAMFWIEYVMRHKTTNHLKIPGIDLAWYQYWLIDIFALVAPIFAILTYLMMLIAIKVLGFLKDYETPKEKTKKS